MQSAIAGSLRKLPPDLPDPPVLRKVNPADSPIIFLALSSPTMPLSAVDDYAETVLAQRLSSLPGVAQVNVYGAQKYRRAHPAQSRRARRAQYRHRRGPGRGPGRQRQPADRHAGGRQGFGLASRPTASWSTPTPSRRQIIAYRNGNPVRFQDIGTVRDSVENNKVATWYNGERAVVLAIQRQPGSNTIQVVDAIRDVLPSFDRPAAAGGAI